MWGSGGYKDKVSLILKNIIQVKAEAAEVSLKTIKHFLKDTHMISTNYYELTICFTVKTSRNKQFISNTIEP